MSDETEKANRVAERKRLREEEAQRQAAADVATGVNQPQKDLPEGIEPTAAGAEGNLPQDLSTESANALSKAVAEDPQQRTIGQMMTLTEASEFRVLHDAVGPFAKGDVVTLQQLGGESQNVMRLIEIGAVEPA